MGRIPITSSVVLTISAYITIAEYLDNCYIWSCTPQPFPTCLDVALKKTYPACCLISQKSKSWKSCSGFQPPVFATASMSLWEHPLKGVRRQTVWAGWGRKRSCKGIASWVNREQGSSGICLQDLCWGAFQRKWVSQATLTKTGTVSHREKIVLHGRSTHTGREAGLSGTGKGQLVVSSPWGQSDWKGWKHLQRYVRQRMGLEYLFFFNYFFFSYRIEINN